LNPSTAMELIVWEFHRAISLKGYFIICLWLIFQKMGGTSEKKKLFKSHSKQRSGKYGQ